MNKNLFSTLLLTGVISVSALNRVAYASPPLVKHEELIVVGIRTTNPKEENISYKKKKETVYATTNVNIRVKRNKKSKKLGLLAEGSSILRLGTYSNGWSKVLHKNKTSFIKSDYLTTKLPYISMKTPPHNSFKSYMPYTAITNRASKQYKLQQKAYTGNYGIRMVGNRYCVAVGSYYTTQIGKKLDLVMKNGSIIPCILADCKANEHTDNLNRQNVNGSIAEFIIDFSKLNKKAKQMGDISYCNNNWEGEIKEIRIYK